MASNQTNSSPPTEPSTEPSSGTSTPVMNINPRLNPNNLSKRLQNQRNKLMRGNKMAQRFVWNENTMAPKQVSLNYVLPEKDLKRYENQVKNFSQIATPLMKRTYNARNNNHKNNNHSKNSKISKTSKSGGYTSRRSRRKITHRKK